MPEKSIQTKPEASSPRSMLPRQASRVRLDTRLKTLCCVQRHHSQMLRPDHPVCWSARVLLSRRIWTIAVLNKSFWERLRHLPPIFLTILNTVEIETSSVPVLPFSGMGRFHRPFWWILGLYPEGFLIKDNPLGTLRPSNVELHPMNSHSADVQLLWY